MESPPAVAVNHEVDYLIGCLSNHSKFMRDNAVERLIEIGQAAVQPLADLLPSWHSDPRTRRLASEALARIGEPAVTALANALSVARSRDLARNTLIRIGVPAIGAAAQHLRNENLEVRQAATEVLVEIGGSQAIQPLTEVLVSEGIRYRLWRRKQLCMRLPRVALYAVAIMGFHMLTQGQARPHAVPLILAALVLSGFFEAADYKRGIRKRAVDALSDTDDLRTVSAFACCLDDSEARPVAVEALKRLLPHLMTSDARCIIPEAMDALVKALGSKDRGLTLAILRAMEHIGDERALPLVERLASEQHSKRDPKVFLAAHECLPALRARVEESRKLGTLLRPAESPDSQVLVRAAGASESDSAQLLRPVDG